jgi:diaminopimelate epimerase
MEIPFTKAHGAENDFLLTWADAIPNADLPEIARRICARTTGIGADGWMMVWREPNGLRTRLFNSDGSEPEISGNGTRCAAAFALLNGVAAPPTLTITTGAGPKALRLVRQDEKRFLFEMDMGLPRPEELHATLQLAGRVFDATTLNVGNPQCVIFVKELPPDWRAAAAQAESHPRFPNRSNVSFAIPVDRHTINAVFYERGAGETRSSGTGATGAAFAAILRNEVESPVEIRTLAGSLELRCEKDAGLNTVFLTGPAEIIGEGKFFLDL